MNFSNCLKFALVATLVAVTPLMVLAAEGAERGIAITGQPQGQTIEEGESVTFSVEAKNYVGYTVPLSSAVNLNMAYCPPGAFQMGSPANELGRDSNETLHTVVLTRGFWIGKYEVSQDEYEAVMGTTPSAHRDEANTLPVDTVSYREAQNFCGRLTMDEWLAGRLPREYVYTLPTEAQWEYACRAGTTNALNSGKNLSNTTTCPEMEEVGWYRGNSGPRTHPRGLKLPNAWGIYDMHGNVHEWCWDWYKDEYPSGVVTNPAGPNLLVITSPVSYAVDAVTRGGSWDKDAQDCRSACRGCDYPSHGGSQQGFRVALARSRNVTVPMADDVRMEMVLVGPGTFTMGSPVSELGRQDDETQHEVTLTQPFWIGQYEVTQAQWQDVMGDMPAAFGSGNLGVGDDLPVYWVSRDEALAFCVKLTERERAAGRMPAGYRFALPTEAQWEYACRGGAITALNDGHNLSATNSCSKMNGVAWYLDNSGGTVRSIHNQKEPNNVHLEATTYNYVQYGMHGNVREWVADRYGAYPSGAVTDPTCPETGSVYILRGGGCTDEAWQCRSAMRIQSDGSAESTSGFRVAIVPVEGVYHDPDELYPVAEPTKLVAGGMSYQWYKDGVAIEGATRSNLTIAAATAADAGRYSVDVWCQGVTNSTSAAALTVNKYVVASVTGWAGAYDGQGHGVDVAVVDPSDDSQAVFFALGDSSQPTNTFSETMPMFTNVCNETVWIEISAAGYKTVTNHANVVITPLDIAGASVSPITPRTYGRFPAEPEPASVTYGGLQLGASTDYALSWESNNVPGTAVVKLVGQGNYVGTKRLEFTILQLPPLTATLRWKYAKDVDGCFCAQVAIPWYAGYNEKISNMRLLIPERYYDYGEHLNEEQTTFFGVSSMIKLNGSDGNLYYLNVETGNVYSEEFLQGGYREKMHDAADTRTPSELAGDEGGTISGWGGTTDVFKYFDEHGAINADGQSFSSDITVGGRTVTLKFAITKGRLVSRPAEFAAEIAPLVGLEDVDARPYCMVPIELSPFANLTDGDRAVFGVSDETMTNAFASVPADERKICLPVVGRGITAAEAIYNARAYLAWDEDGETRTLRLDYNKPWPSIANITAIQSVAGVPAVDFSFDVVNSPELWCPEWNQPFFSIIATDNVTGSNYIAAATALSGDTGLAEGAHSVTWDMGAQGLDFLLSSNVTFKVSYLNMPEYCVIDLSGGADAASCPVTYLDERPLDGWTDDYKTDKLVMRLVAPGTFTMGADGSSPASNPPHEVALTQPFYCAVFETTQRQWELVTGSNPSEFKNAIDSLWRPVERVSCNAVRGVAGKASFLGALRSKSGLTAIDLPTEAQWEYACRAGTTNRFAYGDAPDGDYMWYSGNSGGKTHEVGSNRPNAWGLYDMHGNVREMCLETGGGANLVVRGGGFGSSADSCTSSFRSGVSPSAASNSDGFRLVRTLDGDAASECIGKYFTSKPKAGVVCSAFTRAMTTELVVSNVVARQRWPWNGLVDVDYDIDGFKTWFRAEVSVAEKGEGGATRTWAVTNFLAGAEPTLNQGRNRVTWDTKAAGVTNVDTTAVATVSLVKLDATEPVTLDIVNAYQMDVNVVTAEVAYVFGEIEWTDAVTNASFDKAVGSCSIGLEVPLGAKVRSVVLQVDDVPFEWLDYAEPVPFVGGSLVLDASANEFANGAYAAGTVMQVANPRHLDNVRKHLDGSFRQVKDIDFAGSCGITNAIAVEASEGTNTISCSWGDLDSAATARFRSRAGGAHYGWTPIGTGGAPFCGVYDGGRFRIVNAVCNSTAADGSMAGLFGFVKGSAVKPATIRGVRADASCSFCAKSLAGGIAARAAGVVLISGCESAAEVFAYHGAGILGSVFAGANDVTIAKCVSGGSVYGNRPGGIVSDFSGGTATLDRCIFKGDLFAECMAGGIIQYCGAGDSDKVIVRDCAVTGYIGIPVHDETLGSGGLVGVMSQKTVFEGMNKVRCKMSYDDGARMIGGAVGSSSFSEAQTKEALGSHVEVEEETIHDASSENNVGRYCGKPWINEL